MLKIKSLIFFLILILIFSLFLYSCGSGTDPNEKLDPKAKDPEIINLPGVVSYDLFSNTATLPTISWVLPTTADHALIALKTTDANDVVDFIKPTSTDSHTFTLNSPVACTEYFPQVKFVNAAGTDSVILANEQGIIFSPSIPTQLAGVTLTAATSYDAEISWTKPNMDCDFSHYSVAVKTVSASTNDVMDWTKIPNTMEETKYKLVNGVDGISLNLKISINYNVLIRAVNVTDVPSTTATSSAFNKEVKLGSSEPALYFWLDSADASTMFSNSSCTGTPIALSSTEQDVACWKGKSNNDYTFTGASGKRPHVSDASAGLNFDGASGGDMLTSSSITPTVNTVLEFFVVTKPRKQTKDGDVTDRPIIAWIKNATPFKPQIYLLRDHDTLSTANAIHVGTGSISLSLGTTYLLSASHNGPTKKWIGYIFGELKSTDTLPTSYGLASDLNVGGETGELSRRYAGNILEIIAYSSILSKDNRQKVEGYLACKWDFRDNLQSSHPYYNANPASNTGCPVE